MLRCVAEYLEMTEDYSVGNLVGRAEAYLNEVALKSLAGAVTILHLSEALLPMAEKVKVVSRCIDAIAYIACKESQFSMSGRVESGTDLLNSSLVSHPKHIVDWWAEDLIVLRIDIFQRVLIAMMARGFKQYALGPILMLYAQKSLRGLVRSHPISSFNYMVYDFFCSSTDYFLFVAGSIWKGEEENWTKARTWKTGYFRDNSESSTKREECHVS